ETRSYILVRLLFRVPASLEKYLHMEAGDLTGDTIERADLPEPEEPPKTRRRRRVPAFFRFDKLPDYFRDTMRWIMG
ncbi:hypothetical protein PRIPAC_95847, partial [Pristionchus pacificus]|uniref:Uncharacterized protein n=1 Tax=Pristionchus pacificus TaxID=54126 RepID=A0A2A6B1P1_PRIPA